MSHFITIPHALFRIFLVVIFSFYHAHISVGAAGGSCQKFVENDDGTVPAKNALIVRQGTKSESEYNTISDAVKALSKLNGPQSIFIFPGTYKGHMEIDYKAPLLIQGYTRTPQSITENKVFVDVSLSLQQAGSIAQSSGIWAKSSCFEMRNVNIRNSFGKGTDSQAVALTSGGEQQVFKRCLFSSYQDTLYVPSKRAYFYQCRIEGAVDFIFGAGTAWFEKVQIAVKAPDYTGV
ncbi:hypothetical protein O181_012888, partial [Austropuccinia psidii MF-1]|nr:hypothetical protein [Austropuccinia psidii MF-1]